MPIFHFLGLELGCLFAPIFRFLGLELDCVCLRIFSVFLGLELGCVHLCLLFSRFGIRLFICAYFPFSRVGIRLCSFVPIVFSVWN